jgi:endonuclease YncB( thermonuclease family)
MATVIRIVDGDTIHVSVDGKDKTVRLIGIDTPETHKPGVKIECGGKEASANMKHLAPAGAEVKLTSDPTQDSVDRYGRLLAYVSTPGHPRTSLQLEQVYAGWAEVYVYGGKPFAAGGHLPLGRGGRQARPPRRVGILWRRLPFRAARELDANGDVEKLREGSSPYAVWIGSAKPRMG